jgi:hypothetical protein
VLHPCQSADQLDQSSAKYATAFFRHFLLPVITNRSLSSADAVNPSPSIINPLQNMMSQRILSSQNEEWSGDPLIHRRDYPMVYVDSAGETYEQCVWVIERKGDSSGRIPWKCNLCATERIGPRLSIDAHITGQRFGSLHVHLLRLMLRQILSKKKLINNQNQQNVKRHQFQAFLNLLLPPQQHN